MLYHLRVLVCSSRGSLRVLRCTFQGSRIPCVSSNGDVHSMVLWLLCSWFIGVHNFLGISTGTILRLNTMSVRLCL